MKKLMGELKPGSKTARLAKRIEAECADLSKVHIPDEDWPRIDKAKAEAERRMRHHDSQTGGAKE